LSCAIAGSKTAQKLQKQREFMDLRPERPLRARTRPKDNLMTATRYCQRCKKMVPFGLHPCTPPRKAEVFAASCAS
jgi:hypothetical protein